jgi:acetyl-CoA synthetase
MSERTLPEGRTYEELYARFRWAIPPAFNIGVDICDRHAGDRARVALIHEDDAGRVVEYTFAELRARSNQLANALRRLGVRRGDRVGVVLSQRPELAVFHIATYKLGAIVLPLATLFGPEALEYRLRDAGVRVAVTDAETLDRLLGVQCAYPGLEHVICVDAAAADGIHDYRRLLEREPDHFDPVATAGEDPALLIYTSGTTGPPKGALHAHRMLIGRMPSMEMVHEHMPQPGDRFWTPADWAWAGGLLDMLLPAWHCGIPVVARRFRKFDAEQAFELMARLEVRNVFMPATVLKMLRRVDDPRSRWAVDLRTIHSGGESLAAEMIQWARDALGTTPNEGFGQTEATLVVGNCSSLMPVKPGSMGRPVPGHVVEIVDDAGRPLPAGETGEIAVRRPDPVMFLRYWNNDEATRAKFAGDWMLTGDLGSKDADGYVWYAGPQGRRDLERRLPHRARRDRGMPQCASRGGGRRGRGQPGSDPGRSGQGVRPAARRRRAHARARARAAGARARAALRPRVPARDRVHRRGADDVQRQGQAQGAARARAPAQARQGVSYLAGASRFASCADLSCSALRSAVNWSLVTLIGCAPMPVSRSLTSLVSIAPTKSLFSASATSFGVPAGATKPYHTGVGT